MNDHLLSTMAVNSSFSIVSYNMHGFNQGIDTLKDLCSSKNVSLVFVQEHWLTPDGLGRLSHFSDSYTGFGISAMEDRVSSGVLHGRPYGGVMTLVNNNLVKLIKNVVCSERYVILVIGDLAFVNIYLPCKSGYKVDDFSNLLLDVIDQISDHLNVIGPNGIIVGGDLNTDLRHASLATDIVRTGLISQFNLIECSTVVSPKIEYTYHNIGLGHRTWIDWFLVSHRIGPNITDVAISESALNLSDHLPISLVININIPGQSDAINPEPVENTSTWSKLRWDKADLNAYYDQTRLVLQPIFDDFVPFYNNLMSYAASNPDSYHSICKEKYEKSNISDSSIAGATCRHVIDKYYQLLVDALFHASQVTVPSIKANTLKHWWSDELNDLKNKSLDSFHLWQEAGKPRSGAVFDLYKNSKYAYKCCIKKSKHENELVISNELHDALCNKSNGQFWNIWKSKFSNKNITRSRVIDNLTNPVEIAEAFSNYFGSVCKPNSEEFNVNKLTEFHRHDTRLFR